MAPGAMLHNSGPEPGGGERRRNLQITLLPRTAAVTLARRQIPQPNLPGLDPFLVPAQDIQGLLLGPSDLGLLPTARPAAVAVLDEQMGRSDLAVLGGARDGRVGRRAVVRGHVGFDLVGVGAGRGFPAGFLGRGVEVVREVFGVGVPDLPLGREAGVGSCGLGGKRV